MLHRSLDERPSSSSAKMVEFQQDESHWSFKFPGKYMYEDILGARIVGAHIDIKHRC
jgi:hypothetical protein